MRRSPPTHLVHKHREPSPQWSDGMVDPGKLRQQFRARLSRQGKLRGRSMKISGVHRATSNCRPHAVSSRIIFMLRSLRWRTAPPLVTPGTSQAAARETTQSITAVRRKCCMRQAAFGFYPWSRSVKSGGREPAAFARALPSARPTIHGRGFQSSFCNRKGCGNASLWRRHLTSRYSRSGAGRARRRNEQGER